MRGQAGRGRDVFVSYRRTDTNFVVGHLVDRLERELGEDRIFRDLDSIPYGTDYREHTSESLRRCSAALVVIGPDWVGAGPSGRRIDDPADLVRVEVEAVLARGIPVIPVLVEPGVDLPRVPLPDSLDSLRYRQAMPLRPDPDFDTDVARIADVLRSMIDPEPSAVLDDQIRELRMRLLTASGAELTQLGYEVRALRAEHPNDPRVLQFADQVEVAARGAQAPPAAARAPAPARKRTNVLHWLLPAFAAIAVVVLGAGVFVSQLGGEDPASTPTSTRPTVPPTTSDGGSSTTETTSDSVCDALLVALDPAADVSDDEVALVLENTASRSIELPSAANVSLVASDGTALAVDPGETFFRDGWSSPIALPAGTTTRQVVVVTPPVGGRAIDRIIIDGVRHTNSFSFPTACSFDL